MSDTIWLFRRWKDIDHWLAGSIEQHQHDRAHEHDHQRFSIDSVPSAFHTNYYSNSAAQIGRRDRRPSRARRAGRTNDKKCRL